MERDRERTIKMKKKIIIIMVNIFRPLNILTVKDIRARSYS